MEQMPLIAIIEDENRLDEIEVLVNGYNSGLGEYGTHYSVGIENDTLINKLPMDLINPRCLCRQQPIRQGHTRIDNCPIHGKTLASINELRYEDPLKFDCQELIKQGKMIDAIKMYRAQHQEVGLHDAKKLMMSWED
jgi:hypothetical protein